MIEKLGIRLYNQREAADMLGVTIQTLCNMCRRGQLARTRIGAYSYIPEESLKDYIKGKTSTPKNASHADEQR